MAQTYTIDFTQPAPVAPAIIVDDSQLFTVQVTIPSNFEAPKYAMPDGIVLVKLYHDDSRVSPGSRATSYFYTFVVPQMVQPGHDFPYIFTARPTRLASAARDTKKNKRLTPHVGNEGPKTAAGSLDVSGGGDPDDKQLRAKRRGAVRRRAGRSTRG